MRQKTSRFAFTEATIKALEMPAKGRAWHYDTKVSGLALMATAAGATSFYFYKWANGKPARLLLGKWPQTSVAKARDLAAAHLGTVAAGGDPAEERRSRRQEPTVKELWEHWLLYATAHKKPSSIAEDKRNWNKHLAHLSARRVSSLKKGDVQALHSKIGTECGIYAANRTLALLRAMLNKADDIGYRGKNPASGIKMFTEAARDRFLRPDELKAFFAALDKEEAIFRDFFLMCLLTGARKSNVLTMRWQDIDLASASWRIPETKGGMPVVVPLVAPALNILAARAETATGSPWVFPGHRIGDHLRSPKGSWEEIRAASGLADLRMHDLRRSLGSWMAGQNVSLQIIGKVLGHKTPQATMIYSRVALDPQREAMRAATSAMFTVGGQMQRLEGPKQEGGDDANH